MSGVRLINGKHGSIRDRKKSRHSSACLGDILEGDREWWDGENGLLFAAAIGGGTVAGVSPSLMLGLVPMEFPGVSLGLEVDDEILSSLRSRRISAEDPEEPTIDRIADDRVSILPSSWAIRVSDSSVL